MHPFLFHTHALTNTIKKNRITTKGKKKVTKKGGHKRLESKDQCECTLLKESENLRNTI